ncbi:MAG: hypothetical protein ABIQ18_41930 [Umezawaea sp.]
MTTPLDPEAQSEILSAITERLLFELPAGWNHLQLDYAAVGDYVVSVGLVRMENGAMFGWTPPEDVTENFEVLRSGMARPGRGAWLHATYWLDYPDSYSVDYDRVHLPRFEVPPSGENVARELELFPRGDEFVPDWMREKLAAEHE